jgi:hypothetical protein
MKMFTGVQDKREVLGRCSETTERKEQKEGVHVPALNGKNASLGHAPRNLSGLNDDGSLQ